MSAGNSIIARMGLDLTGLRNDFSAAEKLAIRAAHNMQAAMNHAGKGGHGGGSGSARVLGDSLDAITGERGWVMRMGILQHSLPIAAVAGLALGVTKAVESFQELIAVNQKAHAELNKPFNVAGLSSVAEASQQFEEKTRLIEESREKRHKVAAFVGEGISNAIASAGNAITGDNRFDTRSASLQAAQNELALDAQRFALAKEFGISARAETAARSEAAHISEAEVARTKARQDAEHKIAEIRTKVAPGFRAAAIESTRADLALNLEAIDKKEAAQDRELMLAEHLVSIRATGRNVAVEEAKARIEAADADRAAATTTDQKQAAMHARSEAQLALQIAIREAANKDAELAVAKELSAVIGDGDTRHIASLIAERELIDRKLKTATPDAARDLNRDRDKVQAALRDASFSYGLKAFDLGDAAISSATGRGAAQQQLALYRRIALERGRLQYLQAGPQGDGTGTDPKAIAEQSAKLTGMVHQYQDIADARAKGLRAADDENAVLQAHLDHHDAIAEALRTQASFAEKIRDAEKDGDTALAAKLQKQAQLTAQEQAEEIARKGRDRNQATLAELAKNAHNQTGAAARRALRLEKRADHERVRGHVERSAELRSQADAIKNHIAPLKDSEKTLGDQFANALDAAQVLKDIAENTKGARSAR